MWQFIREIRLSRRRIVRRKPGSPRNPVHRIGLIAGAVVLTMLLGGRARATEWVVTYDGDPGDDSLRDRIDLANNNPGPDTIVFHETLLGKTIHLTEGALHITDDVTIIGPGPDLLTIDGGGVDRIFDINNEPFGGMQVAISGMTLKGGHTPSGEASGGAIRSDATNLTLTDMVITESTADGDPSSDIGEGAGGGIAVIGNSLTVHNSVISNNTAGQPGDGVSSTSAAGGGIYAANAAVEIFGSTISGNTVHNSVDEVFLGAGGGGGVAVFNGSLRLEKSQVSRNTAGNTGNNVDGFGGGGGIFTLESALTIQQSTISSNLAGNAGQVSRYANGDGGGVVQIRGSATITNSTISGNVAGNASGSSAGVLSFAGAGGLSLTVPAEIDSSTITGNLANGADISYGGGITGDDGGFVLLHNTIVAGNGATGGPDLFGDFQASYLLVGNASGAYISGGPMIITGVDPELEPLTDNGGPTETHAIANTSPAYNAGDPLDCPATDQRDVPRPQAGVCDIGAFELAVPLGDLLKAFDGYVQAGTLQGNGPGKSAANRLNAMRNKIATIEALLAEGDTAGACDELASALSKTDGQAPPPDFVTGPAAALLAADIMQTQTDLGCE